MSTLSNDGGGGGGGDVDSVDSVDSVDIIVDGVEIRYQEINGRIDARSSISLYFTSTTQKFLSVADLDAASSLLRRRVGGNRCVHVRKMSFPSVVGGAETAKR